MVQWLSPPVNARRQVFDPCSGKIPQAVGQLSLCVSPRACAPQEEKPLQ